MSDTQIIAEPTGTDAHYIAAFVTRTKREEVDRHYKDLTVSMEGRQWIHDMDSDEVGDLHNTIFQGGRPQDDTRVTEKEITEWVEGFGLTFLEHNIHTFVDAVWDAVNGIRKIECPTFTWCVGHHVRHDETADEQGHLGRNERCITIEQGRAHEDVEIILYRWANDSASLPKVGIEIRGDLMLPGANIDNVESVIRAFVAAGLTAGTN